jgi:predicted anti-sigma-YlaC factor YlaD
MHEPLKEQLEEYLQGRATPEVHEHLANCKTCNETVDEMLRQSSLLRSLKNPREVEPPPGFYARVMSRIESQARPSIWNIFGESLFAKRLTYASLTLLVLMGTYIVSDREEQQPLTASAPEMIMAGDERAAAVGADPQKDREAVLVNLATYQE